ncbi:hypothetical protein IW140_000743 [Coemansia sp. RSA 1813]|nr:hypothetical protein LPJ74_000528 [Coemansia sp. RSA 1843]KAJ2092372.1 hypothetical protein IW138_001134 [Coemansia sp. RSA 986]KAJ2217402.1 hypothetical protein EV179_000552 [Coemansia sp. RSA 487]KAJ2572628.1 hypothetical protein IW140_000743 [Coemansia sp. RSA 1813]
MNPELYYTPIIVPQETLVRHPKTGKLGPGMASGEISLFKLTTSSGNSIEQPVRSSERFSGVLVVQLTRPIPATHIVLTFTGGERRHTEPKASGKIVKTEYFTVDLTVWKAVRKGTGASTVLSDGVHVFNFSCQMPHLNYPQSIQQPQCDIAYILSAKLFSPKIGGGGEFVAAHIEKDIFFTPLVTALPSTQSPQVAETLFFEKKGKKGKPAVELRVGLSNHQIIPRTKLAIDMSIKELSSANWTKINVKLFERTRCRDSVKASFAQPAWSVDRVLVQTDHVRPTVYSFFINGDVMENATPKGNGEPVSAQSVTLQIPVTMCGPLSTENLEFTHFIRIEVVVPSWMSSDRFVYTDIPVQLLAYGLNSTARILHRRASISNIERRGTEESDNSSLVSGNSSRSNSISRHMSQDSTELQNMTLTPEGKTAVLNALPPRYCDVHPVQRPSPSLALVKQANSGAETDNSRESPAKQRLSHTSQSSTHRNRTISSTHSSNHRLTMSTTGTAVDVGEEKYRTRQLPPPPPPLPLEPMPTSIYVQPGTVSSSGMPQSPGVKGTHSRGTSISSQPQISQPHSRSQSRQCNDDNTLVLSPFTPENTLRGSDVTVVQQGFGHMSLNGSIQSTGGGNHVKTPSGGVVSQPRTPLSPVYSDNMSPSGIFSDDDAGYFKSSAANKSMERERLPERASIFRLRKNSSIKQSR